MSDIRVGDTVRLEGVVQEVDGRTFRVHDLWHGHYEGFTVVLRPAPRPKVGDVLEGEEAYATAPVGTIVRLQPESHAILVKYALGEWWEPGWAYPFEPVSQRARTVLYVPEENQ